MFSVQEAVARFFPSGASYDMKKATRLISWLDSCGYAVVPKAAIPAHARDTFHETGTLRPTPAGKPQLRLVK
jgi:hypothetical protein